MSERRVDEAWIRRWHDAHAGATTRSWASRTDANGVSSYDRLARGRAAQVEGWILDLACGDGYLLERLVLHAPQAQCVGIDMSSGELDAARTRLQDTRVELVDGRAQALPFESGRFELVLCHMALMLFDELPGVLSEVRRVLTPAGAFHAILGAFDPRPHNDAWSVLMRLLWTHDFVDHTKLINGDALRAERLIAMGKRAGFAHVNIEPFDLDVVTTPDDVWSIFAESYDPMRLTQASLERLRADFLDAVGDMDQVQCCFPMQDVRMSPT